MGLDWIQSPVLGCKRAFVLYLEPRGTANPKGSSYIQQAKKLQASSRALETNMSSLWQAVSVSGYQYIQQINALKKKMSKERLRDKQNIYEGGTTPHLFQRYQTLSLKRGKGRFSGQNRQLSLIGIVVLCGTSHQQLSRRTSHPKLSDHFLITKFSIPLMRRCKVIFLFTVYWWGDWVTKKLN